jgi:hypothetical protein
LWRYQGAGAECEEDLPRGTPRSESAWTAIHVLMDKRGKNLAILERIPLPADYKNPLLAAAKRGLKTEGLEDCSRGGKFRINKNGSHSGLAQEQGKARALKPSPWEPTRTGDGPHRRR